MSEPNFILTVLKSILKRKSKIIVYTLSVTIVVEQELIIVYIIGIQSHIIFIPRYFILKVPYVFTISEPSELLSPERAITGCCILNIFKFTLAENYRFHSHFIQTVCFGKIQDVELYFGWFVSFVNNFKVIPLRMPFCVQIVLKPQIILYVVHLRRFSEIS